jgi:hypothetical protein
MGNSNQTHKFYQKWIVKKMIHGIKYISYSGGLQFSNETSFDVMNISYYTVEDHLPGMSKT